MPIQISGTYSPEAGLDLGSIVVSSTPVEITADQIAVYALADVDLTRQNEIVNGWKWLFDGIRERNLVDDGGQFQGAICYTYASINDLTVANRRTSSALIDINVDDVVVGLGLNVTTNVKGRTMPLENAISYLAEIVGLKALAA